MPRTAIKPYLVTKDEENVFRVDIRTTRFNSQGYPLISVERLAQGFKTATQARSYLREEYRALAADIATS